MEALPPLNDHNAWDALAQDIAADDSDWSGSVSEQTDPYSILNIPRASSVNDVRLRYRHMSLLFHPDRHATSGSAPAAISSIFPIVSAASTMLSAPAERAAFDILGGSLSNEKSRFDSFSETLLTRAELEKQVLNSAIQTELQRRQRLSQCQLDATSGPSPAATEFQSQAQFDLGTGYDAVGFASSFSRSSSLRSTSILQIFWSRTYDLWTSSKVALAVASSALSFDVIGIRKLSSTTSGQMCVGLRTRLRRFVTLWFRLMHSFSETMLGTLTLTLSPLPNISCNISQRFSSNHRGLMSYNSGVRLSGLNSGLEGKAQYRLNRRYLIFIDVRGFLVDSSLEVGICRRFHHAPGLSLSYSLAFSDSDGVIFNLTAERGPCRIRLPLSLSANDPDPIPSYWKLLIFLPIFVQAGAIVFRHRLRPELSSQGLLYARQRREAIQWQRKHKPEAQSIAMREEDENGLVIVDAQYGDLSSQSGRETSVLPEAVDEEEDPNLDGSETLFPAIVDAVIPLQMMVRDGRLEIRGSIASIPGLFPVRHSPHCRLRIRYRYDCVDHEAIIADGEEAIFPNPSHIIRI